MGWALSQLRLPWLEESEMANDGLHPSKQRVRDTSNPTPSGVPFPSVTGRGAGALGRYRQGRRLYTRGVDCCDHPRPVFLLG